MSKGSYAPAGTDGLEPRSDLIGHQRHGPNSNGHFGRGTERGALMLLQAAYHSPHLELSKPIMKASPGARFC